MDGKYDPRITVESFYIELRVDFSSEFGFILWSVLRAPSIRIIPIIPRRNIFQSNHSNRVTRLDSCLPHVRQPS